MVILNLLLVVLLSSYLSAEEPSVFEMQSSVTKSELKTINGTVSQNSDKIFSLEDRIKQLETALDGLKSVYEGYASTIKSLSDKINSLDTSNYISYDDNRIKQIKEDVLKNATNIQILKDGISDINDNVKSIKDLLSKTSHTKISTASTVDSNSTSKKDSKNILDSVLNDGAKDSKPDSENKSDDSNSFKKDVSKKDDIFVEARRMTYAKKFDDAISRYKWLIEIGYKAPESTFMLGNIAYEQNRYNDAIYYYKESATMDDKAKYMPRLLLNTANSFRVLNDAENASKFYKALQSLFPDSTEAKEAKKHMGK